ncbi:MAG TPA: Gfo/Idh/MocA family oxidoreductase [Longimicrobiales bacterium]|nr:Gfo/Idh/MocA family oxidoreductase [Longimicrobiales bacterium]
MIRIGLVGLGKMGISHLAIANSHPDARVTAACDSNGYVTDVLTRHTGLRCYGTYQEMLQREQLDAVIVSTPSRLHASMVATALERGLHVFCEKPFVLDHREGERLADVAEAKGLANQVGYHFRFVAAFAEAARIAASGALGTIHHVRAEAYGPVVLRPRGNTWRAARSEGGGALYDYASHVIDLINFIVGPPIAVDGVVLRSIFSRDVEDEVYCALAFANSASGQLAVNWSDESYRKMFTRVSLWGSNGRLTADRQECQLYLREPNAALPEFEQGWTIRYTTELTPEVWYYLRGEEYSAQIDYFISSIKLGRAAGTNCFRSAVQTDRVVALLTGEAKPIAPASAKRPALIARVFGA